MLYNNILFGTLLNNLMYNLMKINISICKMTAKAVIYMTHDLSFPDMYAITSVNALKNNDKCIGS